MKKKSEFVGSGLVVRSHELVKVSGQPLDQWKFNMPRHDWCRGYEKLCGGYHWRGGLCWGKNHCLEVLN